MTPVEDLAEIASRAAAAAATVRSAAWSDRDALDRVTGKLAADLARERDLLSAAQALNAAPSAPWADRAEALGAELDRQLAGATGPAPAGDPDEIAGRTRADAEVAATVARIALRQAELAAVQARSADLAAGATGSSAVPGRSTAPAGRAAGVTGAVRRHPLAVNGAALLSGAGAELVHIVRDRPRDLAFRLALSLGFGLGYLVFFGLFLWDPDRHERSFLALYAFSGIAGSAICTNALSVDAARVRQLLGEGRPLWYIMVTKNAALGLIVGALGMTMNLILFWQNGDVTELIKATAVLLTMMLLWFGVGNVLSVVSPLRATPLPDRRHDGTLRPFLFSFVVSYGLSYLVNLMLYWRVWAKQTLLERLGGVWIPVLLIVCSAAGAYILLTVLSLTLVEQPRYRRGLQREMIEYRKKQVVADGTTTTG